ncbi:MAG: SOS response-associated peptidase family protein [Pseudomonadota bacterium]
MTRLYRLDTSADQVAHWAGAQVGRDPWVRGYVAPEKFAPVITAGRDFIAGPRPAQYSGRALRPRIVPRLWGVLPPPTADDPTRRIHCVRNHESPFWIGNLRNSEFRCIVPATAFMLWGEGTDYEGRRLKHWFAPPRLSPEAPPALMALAAVWKDEEIPAFAVLSRAASGAAKSVGAPAMPVVLPDTPEARAVWLHGSWDRARALIDAPSDDAAAGAAQEAPAPLPEPPKFA